ncbi:GumC family protein [Hymenobacter caeli]|uniref:Capsular exopolysaccharide synthesis family protein n=1 Tax=Hymenobacter caeli TaxID=2735894 RepID=A0ABX2FPA0_9BACT|nr:polysaccharide biosynthesis tyrosine autokinase [Hymenobacter caeli]NRT18678.1 capsular exopolysaccharide synthesis family protein [Hymenobacter caeli]
MEMFPLSTEQPNTKSLSAIIAGYVRYWYWFLLGILLTLGCTYAYLRYLAIPKYLVTSTLLIKDDKSTPDLSGTGKFTAEATSPSKSSEDEVEVLQSKNLLLRVVNELSLNTSYYVQGRFKDVEVYEKDMSIKLIINKLDSTAYNKTIIVQPTSSNSFSLNEHTGKSQSYEFGQQITRPYGTFTIVSTPDFSKQQGANNKPIIIRFRSPHDLVDEFSSNITVAPLKKESNLLRVSLVDALPERGRAVVNALLLDYNKEALEDKNMAATSTIAFLDNRLNSLTAELTGVEKNVEQYKRQNEVADVGTQASSYVAQAGENSRKLNDWAAQITVLESIEDYLRQGVGPGQAQLVPSTLGIQDQTLTGLISKFNDLQLERERMLRTAEPGNQLVQTMNEQITNLRSNILENLRNIKGGLVLTSNNLRANSRQFSSRIRNVPVIQRELLEIGRQQAIKQTLYEYLLQKREEASLVLAATTSKSRVIDAAAADPYPVSPNKRLLYLVAVLLGLGVPFAGIFLRDMIDDKVQTRQDVEQLTHTPILGELAHNTDGTVIVTKNNRSPAAETFRFIRANLTFAAGGRENKVLLITSGMSGEGKTFFSINLGASLVLAGKRVLLLELDLRKPALSQELDLTAGPGLTDYLVSNDMLIHDLIKASNKVPGLMVISSGPTPPNPAELMMSPKVAHLLSELRQSFDYIIIDTAPVGLVADALSLSPLVDSSIYLIRRNYTYKKQVAIVENLYRSSTLSHCMIVLNDVNGKNTYGYGYGYDDKSADIVSNQSNMSKVKA